MSCFFGIGESKHSGLTCLPTLVPPKDLRLSGFAQIDGFDDLELTCQPMHVGRKDLELSGFPRIVGA